MSNKKQQNICIPCRYQKVVKGDVDVMKQGSKLVFATLWVAFKTDTSIAHSDDFTALSSTNPPAATTTRGCVYNDVFR